MSEDADNSKSGLVGRKIDRYEIKEVLGRGGSGVVYRAVEAGIDREVAIKVLTPGTTDPLTIAKMKKRFLNEAKAIGQLKSPVTVKLFNWGKWEDPPRFFLVMEYISGQALDAAIVSDQAFEPLRSINVIAAVLRSLREAHHHGVIHRDIKPQNIMLEYDSIGDEERVRLLDFGITKVLDADEQLTQSGGFLGTPRYVAPEVFESLSAGEDNNVGPWTDIYALGISWWEMLEGGAFMSQLGNQVLSWATWHNKETAAGHPIRLSQTVELPDGVKEIWERMVARDPADRYQDTKDVLEDLNRLQATSPEEYFHLRQGRTHRPQVMREGAEGLGTPNTEREGKPYAGVTPKDEEGMELDTFGARPSSKKGDGPRPAADFSESEDGGEIGPATKAERPEEMQTPTSGERPYNVGGGKKQTERIELPGRETRDKRTTRLEAVETVSADSQAEVETLVSEEKQKQFPPGFDMTAKTVGEEERATRPMIVNTAAGIAREEAALEETQEKKDELPGTSEIPMRLETSSERNRPTEDWTERKKREEKRRRARRTVLWAAVVVLCCLGVAAGLWQTGIWPASEPTGLNAGLSMKAESSQKNRSRAKSPMDEQAWRNAAVTEARTVVETASTDAFKMVREQQKEERAGEGEAPKNGRKTIETARREESRTPAAKESKPAREKGETNGATEESAPRERAGVEKQTARQEGEGTETAKTPAEAPPGPEIAKVEEKREGPDTKEEQAEEKTPEPEPLEAWGVE